MRRQLRLDDPGCSPDENPKCAHPGKRQDVFRRDERHDCPDLQHGDGKCDMLNFPRQEPPSPKILVRLKIEKQKHERPRHTQLIRD